MLVIGIVCLGLGILILRMNPYLKISQLYLVTMCMVAIYASAIFIFHNALSENMALMFSRWVMLCGVLVSSSVLYISLYPPYEGQGSWPIKRKHDFLLFSAAAAVVAAAIPPQVMYGDTGYWMVPNDWTLIWLAILGLLAIPAMLFLNKIWDRSEDERFKRHCTIVSIALFMPLVFTFLDTFIAWSSVENFRLVHFGLLGTSLIFAYAIWNYKPFDVPVLTREKSAPAAPVMMASLGAGHCDLIKGKKSDTSYRMFISEVESGSRGLMITNLHPDQVRERYGQVKAPIMWLSGQPGQDRLDPAALTIIQHTMVDFIQKGDKSIILLDGLDYLISENQLEKVLKMIYAVHDAVVVSGSKFIVPIDPLTIDGKDLAFIEKEFVVFEEAAVVA